METENKRVYDLEVKGIDSFNDLKKAIEGLTEKLNSLNAASAEYKETLEELTKLQSQLSSSMDGVTDTIENVNNELSKANSDEGFAGLKENIKSTTTATAGLDETLTKDAETMKELRSQINGLRNHLLELKYGTKEYEETVDVLNKKVTQQRQIMSATKESVNALDGSYEQLAQRMAALKRRWRETNDEAERAALGKDIATINEELKRLDDTIGIHNRHVGDYTNAIKKAFSSPREEIRALRNELFNLDQGSEEYNATLRRMADLTTQQRKLNEQLRFSSSDLGDIMGNLAGAASGVIGGFSALYNLMGLLGNQNGDLQKAMLKTQQLMAIVQGLSKLENLRDRFKGLADGIKGFVSRMGAANKSTKEFSENTKVAASEAERATGSIDAQAGSASKLLDIEYKLTEAEQGRVSSLREEITVREAKIAVIEKERERYEQLFKSITENKAISQEDLDWLTKEKKGGTKPMSDEIKALESEIEERKQLINEIEREARARQLNEGEIDQEILSSENYIKVTQDVINQTNKEIKALESKISLEEAILKSEKESFYDSRNQEGQVRERIAITEKRLAQDRESLELAKQKRAELTEEMVAARQELSIYQERFNKIKQLEVQKEKYSKLQLLSIAHTKLEIAETRSLMFAQQAQAQGLKRLAVQYTVLATTARVASVAVKGVKAALISSGIGLIIVGISSALSKIGELLGDLWDNITGAARINAQLKQMNEETEAIVKNLGFMRKLWDAFGYTDFKKQTKEIYNLKAAVESASATLNKAIKEGSDMAEEYEKKWAEVNEELGNAFSDARIMVLKLMNETEKADRQKGMTQLQIDLDETNQKFADAIALVQLLGKEGKMSMEEVDEYVKRLNNDLQLARQMLIEKDASGKTDTGHTKTPTVNKEKEEADKLYKQLVENSKREEQKLKEKYEKEKKLLEKYHKDTKLLTEQYNKDMEKLLTERQKAEYDKWVAHLNSVLNLQDQNSLGYYEQQLENLKRVFSATFGGEWDNPIEDFFNIQKLDEFGSKAISITDDIAESMRMIGLDPSSIDDVEKMIDNFNEDKKAIENATKALKEFKSNLKFTEFENQGTGIENELERALTNIDNKFAVLETKGTKMFGKDSGFYTGLSPEQMEEEFNERYAAMEQWLNAEYELWLKASTDETLSVEDRNKAVAKLNEVMAKQNSMAVQKEIDANNLLIKSFDRVSSAMMSMAQNVADVLSTVSNLIMENAQRQLEAGEITQEEYNRQFERSKAIQIAQATVNTIAGAVGAFMGITRDTGGWGVAAAAIEAAAILASGFAQIAIIRNTKPENGSSSSSSGGGGATTFNLPSVMLPEPQRVQNTTNQDDIDQLKNALGDQKVYVVESDISAALNSTNKRRTEVTF